MNIGSPISSVIPTLDAPVLEVLVPSAVPLSLTEIGRRSRRGALSGIRLVLQRLVAEGLVLEVPGGYVLNREHLAFESIESLCNMRAKFLQKLTEEITHWEFRTLLVGMFGSFARREGDSSSDLDLLIVSEQPALEKTIDQISGLMRSWTGNKAQVIALTTDDIRRMKKVDEPILSEWRREIEVLHGDVKVLAEG